MGEIEHSDVVVVSHVPVRNEGGTLFTRGGFGRAMDSLAPYFRVVYLVTCSGDVVIPGRAYRITSENVILKAIPSFWRYRGLFRWLGEGIAGLGVIFRLGVLWHRVDLFHPRLPSVPGEIGALMAKIGGRPMWMLVAGDREELLNLRGWPRSLLAGPYRRLFRFLTRGELCFGVGPDMTEKLRQAGSRVEMVIDSTLDEEWIVYEADAEARSHGPVRRGLFVGGIGKEKGCDTILAALGLLKQRDVLLHVNFIGECADEGRWLQEVAEEYGVSEQIEYRGPMAWQELMRYYERHQVFLLPSRSEATPMVILEAMARGVPVIASSVGGIPAYVSDRVSGLLVCPGSVENLAEALIEVIRDADLRERMVRAGLAIAREHTVSKLADHIVRKVYEEIVL